MNLVCVICSDLLTPSDDVFYTPCGHIFHYACLLQWLERAQTCPQCRERTTSRMIHRIYFNFSNNDNIEDTASLQQKIDNMTFQLKLKDVNLDKLKDMNEELKIQTIGLRHEVLDLEREVASKRSESHALKDQIKFYKQQCLDADDYRKENETLKSNLEHLKNIQNLVNHSTPVDPSIIATSDASKLITYITVLKRELSVMSEKSKEIREKYKNIQQKYMSIDKENKFLSQKCAKIKKLEDELMICESEKISLETQLIDLQTDARKCVCNKVSANKPESLNAYEEHNAIEESNVTMNECAIKIKGSNLRLQADDGRITIALDKTENTSQNLQSQGSFSMGSNRKRQNSSNNLKIPSILVKKRRFNQPSQYTAGSSHTSFDGFGGHGKYDLFPKPIPNLHVKKNKEISKMRKPKLDTGDNQKISDVLIIDD